MKNKPVPTPKVRLTVTQGAENPHLRTLPIKLLNADLKCVICLGIIRSATVVSHCLHRFCRECIHNSLRYGKKECPTCRMKCSSHRDLKPDTRFDVLIRTFYPKLEDEIQKQEEQTARVLASISPISTNFGEPGRCVDRNQNQIGTDSNGTLIDADLLDTAQSLSSSTQSIDLL